MDDLFVEMNSTWGRGTPTVDSLQRAQFAERKREENRFQNGQVYAVQESYAGEKEKQYLSDTSYVDELTNESTNGV